MSEAKKHIYDSYQIKAGDRTTAAGNKYKAEYTTLLSGRLPISVLMFTPENPTAIVQLVHGMCEYKERYVGFMERLADNGYACIIHDHRGHGASVLDDKDYGFMYEADADTLVSDAHQITVYAKRKWSGLPVVLFGHSMGSLVVRTYLKKFDYEPSAVILSGPPCSNRGAGFGVVLSGLLCKLLGGRAHSNLLDKLSLGMYQKAFIDESKCSWICSDKEVVGKYEKNPLCAFTFTLNGYYCLTGLLYRTFSKRGWNLSNPSLPILFSAGADDPCAGSEEDFKGSVMFMWKLGYYHVLWKRYKDMRHELLNESWADIVISDYLRFINKSLKQKNIPNKAR